MILTLSDSLLLIFVVFGIFYIEYYDFVILLIFCDVLRYLVTCEFIMILPIFSYLHNVYEILPSDMPVFRLLVSLVVNHLTNGIMI